MKLNIFIPSVIYFLLLSGCIKKEQSDSFILNKIIQQGQQNQQENIINSVIVDSLKQKKFKLWLSDTLIILNQKMSKDQEVGKNDITISNDSLLLSVTKNYDVFVTNNKTRFNNVTLNSIISTLSDYNELPNQSFFLKVTENLIYTPAFAEQILYDFNFHIEEIKVSFKTTIITYSYSKGSLIEKNILNENGVTEIYHFTFDDGGKLIKKLISN